MGNSHTNLADWLPYETCPEHHGLLHNSLQEIVQEILHGTFQRMDKLFHKSISHSFKGLRKLIQMKPSKVDQLWEQLQTTSRRLCVLGTLSDGEQKRVTEAITTLSAVQRLDRRNKYKLFLFNILHNTGPAAVLLCAVGLGQGRVTAITTSEREQLCQRIQSRWSVIGSRTLEDLAAANHVPRSVDGRQYLFSL